MFRRLVGRGARPRRSILRVARGALGPERFHHHQCVDPIPEAPVGLGSPYLVEQRLELRLKIGFCADSALHVVSYLKNACQEKDRLPPLNGFEHHRLDGSY
jgi:hypothetical protein